MLSTGLAAVTLFYTFGMIHAETNCSLENPCGLYGYCRDMSDANVTCECKFWWEGDHCNTQGKSGVQVIVLGCLLGLLIIIFYALKIFFSVRNKKKRPATPKKKKYSYDEKIFRVAMKIARRNTRLGSCITVLLTMIVAAAGLLGKWGIIQRIHDQIVSQYLSNEPIYYKRADVCNIFDYQDFNLVTISVASFLVLVFIIRSRRIACLKQTCKGHGAIPMPLDFLSHIDRKYAAFVFAICADELIAIMLAALTGSGSSGEGVIISYLRRLLTVLIMSLRYFPMLAAVYINSLMTLFLGTIYSWLDFSLTIYDLGMCDPDFYPSYEAYLQNESSIEDLLKYYGTGPSLIAIQLCTDIPRIVCLAYITVKLPMKFIHKLHHRFKPNLTSEERMMMKMSREQRILIRISQPESMEMLYVRNLFRGRDNRLPTQSVIGRIIPKFIYEWRDDFRFSARIICVYASLLLLLYFVTIQACVQVVPILSSLQDILQQLIDAVSSVFYPIPGTEETDANSDTVESPPTVLNKNFVIPPLVRPYVIAIHITLVLISIQLLVFLANVRRNLFQVFRGDDTEIPRRQKSRYVSYSSGNIHFAGYFIGYLIWGYIIIGVFAVLICISIEALVLYGSVRFLEKILKAIIPSLLFVFFKQFLNKILAQYVFLQHQGEVLALNNRRILMVFIYFNFFLDAFLGFISSIMRLVKSLIGGILYMCRLDYSPLGRKLEGFDGGFSAYCGFIHTECTHRHPVMLAFVSILYSQMQLNRMSLDRLDPIGSTEPSEKYRVRTSSSSRYRRKWRLAAFLVRNPSIVFFRKALLNQFHLDDIHPFSDSQDKNQIKKKMSEFTERMSNFKIDSDNDNEKTLQLTNRF